MAARKKAAKKKAAKRKIVRKKVAKKKVVKRPRPRRRPVKKSLLPELGRPGKRPIRKPPAWAPVEFTVTIRADGSGVDGARPRTKRSRRDMVRWVNRSDTTFTLEFVNNLWPFEGNPCSIVVPAGGQSGWYRIESRPEEHGIIQYWYYATPAFDAAGTPPGDPVVDAGD